MPVNYESSTSVDELVVVSSPVRRVDVTGDDRQRYLEDVTTQHVVDAPIGSIRGALHLDPHGAPLGMFDLVTLGDRLVLLAPNDELATWIVETLGGRTFLLDARFELVDDSALAVRGHRAGEVLAAAGLGHVEGRCRLADGVLIVDRPSGVDLIAPEATLSAISEELVAHGARVGDSGDLERWRIRAALPAWASEVRHPHLPEEAGVLATHVHLAKGCYPGQEAVARMWMLGRPRRRLLQLAVAERETPPSEALAVEITSCDPEGEMALGYGPAAVTPGALVEGSGTRWKVVQVVGDESPPGHDPAVTRRRDRPRR
ncbi:MAG: hypothetical protein WD152_01255 [Nitriliruptoraceae bacterium]